MPVQACLFLGLFFPAFVVAQTGPGFWEVQMIDGHPYLTVEAIQRNYGFTDLKGDAERFELSSPTARLEGRTGASSILLNRLRYELHHPLEAKDRHRLVSAYDLSNLIDLLFRPAEHLRGGEVKTVYLQTDSADGLAAKPVAAEVVLALQSALSDLGFTVRSVPADATRLGSHAISAEEPGSPVWLRLRGNPKLPADFVRCAVLAPPDSPKREANRAAVYAGNLVDAESLALATLLQSGLVFGPGAKVRKVTDGAISQDLVRPFQSSPGAAVLVEWGKEFRQDHLLKSLAAGLVRYQAFLGRLAQEQTGDGQEVTAADVLLKDVQLLQGPEGPGLAGSVKKRVGGADSLQSAREQIQLQFYLFEVSPGGELKLLQTPPAVILGSDLSEGKGDPAEIGFFLPLSADLSTRLKGPDAGYAVRLIWQGKEQDVAAQPERLRNQLGHFSGLYP
ncbi:MAG: hypothetical protein DVB23_002234 [Verrucomicrobia bacterium]|nr:MAG: hypothetical protein DVB23_002234 [Verrucomicrobiota bacterium]